MNNSTYVILGVIIILVTALINVIDVSPIEKPMVKEVPISKIIPEISPTPTSIPTPIDTTYRYSIAIGSAGQIAYTRNYPAYCMIAIGSAGQKAIQGDCDKKDYDIIDTEVNK